MAHARQAGRPSKAGPRYASGRLKPNSDRATGTFRQRAREAARRRIVAPEWGSEIELLGPFCDGVLTHAQVETGHQIARIYGAYQRLHGHQARNPTGPGYVRWIPTPPTSDDDPQDDRGDRLEDDADQDERVSRATRRWRRLQDTIDSLPLPPDQIGRARDLIEHLCVGNQPMPAASLPDLRAILDHVGRSFGRRGASPAAPDRSAVPPIAITARRAPRQPDRKPAGRPANPRTPHEQALLDRDRYRAEKARRRA